MIAAFALTEPEAGSDAAAIKTTAVFDEAKNEFVLNGTKHWISNGGFADFFTVFARDEKLDATDEHREITAFVVTADLGASRPARKRTSSASRARRPCRSTSRTCACPANVLGERGHGFKIAVEVLNTGRTSLAAGLRRRVEDHAPRGRAPRDAAKAVRDAIAGVRDDPGQVREDGRATYALESMVYFTTGLIDRASRTTPSRAPAARSSARKRSGATSTTRSRSPAATASWRTTRTRRPCATRGST